MRYLPLLVLALFAVPASGFADADADGYAKVAAVLGQIHEARGDADQAAAWVAQSESDE